MRRWAIVTAALAVGAFGTATPAAAQLSAGVSAGATLSTMGGNRITSTDSDWGVLLGGYGRYRFVSNLALQLEANFVQKGGRGAVVEGDVDFDLDYVEVPLTAQLVVGLGPAWDWNLYGGIALAFRTTCGISLGPGDPAPCDEVAPSWSFADTEWSVPFGTSFTRRFSRSALTADFRYSYGLSAAIENLDLKNRSWELILRWGFEV